AILTFQNRCQRVPHALVVVYDEDGLGFGAHLTREAGYSRRPVDTVASHRYCTRLVDPSLDSERRGAPGSRRGAHPGPPRHAAARPPLGVVLGAAIRLWAATRQVIGLGAAVA